MSIYRFLIVWISGVCIGGQVWAAPVTPPELARQIIQGIQNGAPAASPATLATNVLILQGALSSYPKDAAIRFALGSCYLAQGKANAAQAVLAQAHSIVPNDPLIGMTYVLALKADKQLAKADDTARQISFAHPDSPQFQMLLVALDETVQKYDEAVSVLHISIASAPADLAKQDQGAMLFLLGNCYLHQGKRTEAVATLEKANTLFPHAATILCALAEATLKNGETARARDFLDQTLAINPKMPAALFYRGIMMERAGAPDKAREYFSACYANGKLNLQNNGEDYYRMALVCTKLNKPEESKQYQAEAAKLLYTSDAPWGAK